MAVDPYPTDWQALREAVHLRDRDRCQNCRVGGETVTLDVHHVVPRGQGGSNRLSNLILLCRRCHEAAHGERMAPRVKFYSNGSMSGGEFREYRRFWDDLEVARFDPEEDCWYVPKADLELLREQIAA